MTIIPVPRARDDEVLAILAALASGNGPLQVGRMFGTTTASVSVLRQRVMAADLAESGEPHDLVAGCYR